jgi:hypothetical protein
MDKKYKNFLDEGISRLTEKEIEFKITSIAIIEMMNSDEDLKEELAFYWRIVEAICDKETNISYEEKEQFLAMHTAAVEVYNNDYRPA